MKALHDFTVCSFLVPCFFSLFFFSQHTSILQVSKGNQFKYKNKIVYQKNIAVMYGLSGKFMAVRMKSENRNHVSLNCGLDSTSTWKCIVWCLVRASCSSELESRRLLQVRSASLCKRVIKSVRQIQSC